MFEAMQTRTTATGRTPLRLLFLTGASLMVLTGSALAADLPVKAPPPAIAAASLSSWAGFYLGVHGGHGWKTDDFSRSEADFFNVPGTSLNGVKSQGAVYGAQAGYNWQFGRAVTGLEIDFSATPLRRSVTSRAATASAKCSPGRPEQSPPATGSTSA